MSAPVLIPICIITLRGGRRPVAIWRRPQACCLAGGVCILFQGCNPGCVRCNCVFHAGWAIILRDCSPGMIFHARLREVSVAWGIDICCITFWTMVGGSSGTSRVPDNRVQHVNLLNPIYGLAGLFLHLFLRRNLLPLVFWKLSWEEISNHDIKLPQKTWQTTSTDPGR